MHAIHYACLFLCEKVINRFLHCREGERELHAHDTIQVEKVKWA